MTLPVTDIPVRDLSVVIPFGELAGQNLDMQLDEIGVVSPLVAIVPGNGFTDGHTPQSYFYRQGTVVHAEGAIVTPTSPSAGDVIFTFADGSRPATTQRFALPDIGTGRTGVATVDVIAEADTPGHGGEVRWVGGVHGAGVVLSLSPVHFLDPWRRG